MGSTATVFSCRPSAPYSRRWTCRSTGITVSNNDAQSLFPLVKMVRESRAMANRIRAPCSRVKPRLSPTSAGRSAAMRPTIGSLEMWKASRVFDVCTLRFRFLSAIFPKGRSSVKAQPRILRHNSVASEIFSSSPLQLRRLLSD